MDNLTMEFGIRREDVFLKRACGGWKTYEVEDGTLFLDGWLSSAVSPTHSSFEQRLSGVYNQVHWNHRTGRICVTNDLLGQRPIWLACNSAGLMLSNDFWVVQSWLGTSTIDIETVDQLLAYRRVTPPWKTLDRNIVRLPAGGSATWKSGESVLRVDVENVLRQDPDVGIDVKEAADQLDESLMSSIEALASAYPERSYWFGNSGGSDSRLIPAYAERAGIQVHGFSVSEPRPRLVVNQTIRSGRRIGRRFSFPTQHIGFADGDGWRRLIRDIRVSPLGPANFHKNARFWDFLGSVVVNGGNSFTIANDSNAWRTILASGDPARGFVDHYIRRPFLSDDFGATKHAEAMASVIRENHPNIDGFSLLRSFHQVYLNQTSPTGAFESMSLAGDFHYLYHPFATRIAIRWPEVLFYNRAVQTELLATRFPDLCAIPDQSGNFPTTQCKARTLIARAVARRTGSGLMYSRWMNTKWFVQTEATARDFVGRRGGEQAIRCMGQIEQCHYPQDKLDTLKLAVLLAHLESGSVPTHVRSHAMTACTE